MGDNQAIVDRIRGYLVEGNFTAMVRDITELATDDFVQEWPQSGERIRRDNAAKLFERYAEETGTSPSFTFKRMIGGGDIHVAEGAIDYGDGTTAKYVGILELRDGKIARVTEYFANPFEAPEWRRQYVEPADAGAGA